VVRRLLTRWITGSVREKGLRGGSSLWLAVGAFNFIRRLYQRKARRSESIALGEKLRPGDELVLRYPGAPGRKVRKEQRIVADERARVAAERAREIAALRARVDRGGRKGRKAARALASMRDAR
jgi:hypothetical protein